MQFMYPIAQDLANELAIPKPTVEDLYRPELSIQLGCYQIRRMLDRFGDSIEKALAAYNGGPGNVERWEEKLSRPNDVALYVTNIGFRETKLYVLKVLGDYHSYRAVYGDQPFTKVAAGD
jgi:soluble lytic murein transglycosylase